MKDKTEVLIKLAYTKWRNCRFPDIVHPDEEALACFIEGRLAGKEINVIQRHILRCHRCSQIVAVQIEGSQV